MLVLAPMMDGNNGLYRHIMRVNFGSSNIQIPVTHGSFEVSKIHGWDKEGKYM